MRRCPYCKVGIKGDLMKCPLCQSKLSGTGEEPCFPELHWSLLLAMWLMGFEFGIMRQFKLGTGLAGKVTMLVLITIAMWCVTAYYLVL